MSTLGNARETADAYRKEVIRIMEKHPEAFMAGHLGADREAYMAACAQHAHWHAIAQLQDENKRLIKILTETDRLLLVDGEYMAISISTYLRLKKDGHL